MVFLPYNLLNCHKLPQEKEKGGGIVGPPVVESKEIAFPNETSGHFTPLVLAFGVQHTILKLCAFIT